MARVAKRTRKRMACQLLHGRQRFSGVVLDLSSSGLFIQTTAKPSPREPVVVELSAPGRREAIRVEAHVARLFVVPAQLVTVAQGGIGLRITNASEAYFELLQQLQLDRRANDAVCDAAKGGEDDGRRPYRVRVTQLGGTRTRTIEVRAGSSEEAALRARAELGDGWKVLEAAEQADPR